MNPPVVPTAVAAGSRDGIVHDGAVEVTISFPPIALSVSQAQALRSGRVIELGCRLVDAELDVRVSGLRVATGHLVVLVEEHAGVMLSHVKR